MRRNPRAAAFAILLLAVFRGEAMADHGVCRNPSPASTLEKAIRSGDEEGIRKFLSEPGRLRVENQRCPGGESVTALAAAYGRIDVLDALLETGASVEGSGCPGASPLVAAASQGHLEAVRFLLLKGAKADSGEGQRRTPLLAAVDDPPLLLLGEPRGRTRNSQAIARMLLDAGADPDGADRNGVTPLGRAVVQADARLARLLRSYGADSARPGPDGKSPLDLAKEMGLEFLVSVLSGEPPGKEDPPSPPIVEAAKAGKLDEADRLLWEGAGIDDRDGGGNSALLHASARGHYDVVRMLANAGADPDLRNQNNATPLMHAASAGFGRVVGFLLAKGADFRARDRHGNDAMRFAASLDRVEVIELLAARNADAEGTDGKGVTLLMSASARGSVRTVRALLSAGALVNAADGEGRTALMHAAKEGRLDAAEVLVAAGAELQAKDGYGDTALRIAVDSGHGEVAGFLESRCGDLDYRALRIAVANGDLELTRKILGRGVDPNREPGEVPLLVLAAGASRNRIALTRLLIEHGARVDDRDADRKSALMEAARGSGAESAEVVEFLLANGAAPTARDAWGRSAWSYAMESGRGRNAKAIERAGARPEPEALGWRGHFFRGGGTGSSAVIENPAAWEELWRALEKDGECPEIDFGRYVVVFVCPGTIGGHESEVVEIGKPGLDEGTLVVPWSTSIDVSGENSVTTPYSVRVLDRQGAEKVVLRGKRAVRGH